LISSSVAREEVSSIVPIISTVVAMAAGVADSRVGGETACAVADGGRVGDGVEESITAGIAVRDGIAVGIGNEETTNGGIDVDVWGRFGNGVEEAIAIGTGAAFGVDMGGDVGSRMAVGWNALEVVGVAATLVASVPDSVHAATINQLILDSSPRNIQDILLSEMNFCDTALELK
jgi:hypothetical protein